MADRKRASAEAGELAKTPLAKREVAAVLTLDAANPRDQVLLDCLHRLAFRIHRDIVDAIRDYHLALDNREHGDIPSHHALERIQAALRMPWRQGAEKARRTACGGDNP